MLTNNCLQVNLISLAFLFPRKYNKFDKKQIEFVLGFHKVDAFNRVVEWAKPDTVEGKIGIRNLRFGEIITDIEAFQGKCMVTANEGYTLKINGNSYEILGGENAFDL